MAVKLKLTPEKGTEAEIAHAHTIHQQAQVVPWKLSTFEDCFTKPYYGVFAYENEQVIGYAIVLEVADEATLMDIAVDDAFRGQGVGRALVDYVLTASEQNRMIEMWLEGRESNLAAIKLYESSGFEHIETRKNYYTTKSYEANSLRTGKENAKIMKWSKAVY